MSNKNSLKWKTDIVFINSSIKLILTLTGINRNHTILIMITQQIIMHVITKQKRNLTQTKEKFQKVQKSTLVTFVCTNNPLFGIFLWFVSNYVCVLWWHAWLFVVIILKIVWFQLIQVSVKINLMLLFMNMISVFNFKLFLLLKRESMIWKNFAH